MSLHFAVPAGVVPVPTQIGGFLRDRYVVSHARRNLLMTSGANIGFEGLVGLYAPYFDRSVEARPDARTCVA